MHNFSNSKRFKFNQKAGIMIKGQNIICLGLTAWKSDYMKSVVELMSILARENTVVFVDYPYTYKDVFKGVIHKSSAPVKRMLGLEKRLQKVAIKDNHKIHVLTLPPMLPLNWINSNKIYERLIEWDAQKISKTVNKAIEELNMSNPVVINAFNPIYGLSLAGKFQENLLVYYCYDEIRHAHWCKKHGGFMEDKFVRKVDAVITSSEHLHEVKSQQNENCYLLKNGVGFDLFHKAYKIKTESNEVKESPVIGYMGSVDDRLDYDLLEYCFENAPEYQFHFVGRVIYPKGKKRLEKYSNVHLLGSHQPEELPFYLAAFDVGIIPFVSNGFTKGIYPLKINEYLASGIPVITTDFGNLKDFEKTCSIKKDKVSFLQAIRDDLKHNDAKKIKNRIDTAKANSWDNRVERLSQIIEELSEKHK